MTTPFKRLVVMRRAFLVAALILPVIALALPDDATLSRLLVGTWNTAECADLMQQSALALLTL